MNYLSVTLNYVYWLILFFFSHSKFNLYRTFFEGNNFVEEGDVWTSAFRVRSSNDDDQLYMNVDILTRIRYTSLVCHHCRVCYFQKQLCKSYLAVKERWWHRVYIVRVHHARCDIFVIKQVAMSPSASCCAQAFVERSFQAAIWVNKRTLRAAWEPLFASFSPPSSRHGRVYNAHDICVFVLKNIKSWWFFFAPPPHSEDLAS